MNGNEDRLREALRTVSREVKVSEEDTAHAQHRVTHHRAQLVSQRRRRSASALTAAAAVLAVALGSAAVLQNLQTSSVGPAAPLRAENGWVAIGADDGSDGGLDIYLVRQGEDAHRLDVAGSDATSEACPVWSPDGTRLMFGRVTGSPGTASSDAELVIVPVDQSGTAGTPTVIALEGFDVFDDLYAYGYAHPCGTWAPDGRWVAFAGTGQVWVVDTQTGATRRLTDLRPSDLEWRPGSDELAIAGDLGTGGDTLATPVTVYSVSTGELRRLDSVEAAHITWSPDGTTLAYNGGENAPPELWLVDGDGANQRLLVADLGAVNHGIGPVWSPTGDRIAYQRLIPIGRELHEVVLVNVADGTETVIDPPQTDGQVWYPRAVTWSPDGATLLYAAWTVDGEGTHGRGGLIAVPADTPSNLTVLTDAINTGPYISSHQWTPIQMWGRQPG